MRGARVAAFAAVFTGALGLVLPAAAGPGAGDASTAEVAIFYYPWYSNPEQDGEWAHWYLEHQGEPVLSTAFYPRRGLYSSASPTIVAAHMREIRASGVTTVVVSWWGEESPEAERLPLVTEIAREHGLRVAIHIEPYDGRTPQRVAEDIRRLQSLGYVDFYVYEVELDPDAVWAEALDGLDRVRIFGQTPFAGSAKASGFDGLYTYDVLTWAGSKFRRLCAQARQLGLLCAPSVGPGFDARRAAGHAAVGVRLRKKGRTYDLMWRAAIDARADVVTITSYNEWQEGTQIEPARRQAGRPAYDGAWGRRGLRAQAAYLDATSRWSLHYAATARR